MKFESPLSSKVLSAMFTLILFQVNIVDVSPQAASVDKLLLTDLAFITPYILKAKGNRYQSMDEGTHSGPELKILCFLKSLILIFSGGFWLKKILSLFSKLHKILNSGPL